MAYGMSRKLTQVAGLFLCALVWGQLSYLVVIKLGLTEYSVSSDEYVGSGLESWKDVLNLKKLTREIHGCEPATLVPGETYRTLNDVFAYTVKDVIHSRSHKRLSSASYSGTPLTSCSVDTMIVQSTLLTHEMKIEATIRCPLAENQVLVLSMPSRVSIETEGTDHTTFNHTSKPLSMVLPRIISLYDFYVFTHVLRTGQLTTGRFGNAVVSSMYFKAEMRQQSDIHYIRGIVHGPFASIGYDGAINELSKTCILSIENYIRILWSAILTDLGAESDSNVLTDSELLRKKVPSMNRGIFDEKTMFMSPLDPIEPTRLNVQYRCVAMKWKSTGQFVSDLLVGAVYVFAGVVVPAVLAARLGLFPSSFSYNSDANRQVESKI